MTRLRTVILASLATVLSGAAGARILAVGEGQEFKQPSDAIEAAREGDRVLIQPGEYLDCATLRADKLVVEGIGDPAKVLIAGKSCYGKGLFITTGTGITVRNLTLARARVADGNGAGIRMEGADLTVEGVRFVDNQNGILAAPPAASTLTVRNSLFDRNGSCEEGKGCAHGIYAGSGALLHVEDSVFTATRQGHHIKSRLPRTEIIGCSIQDGSEGTASYLVDIPNGGSVVVRDNRMEKGPGAGNHSAAIVIGAEGVTQPTREILIQGNTFRNDGSYSTFFVKNMTATGAVLTGNRLSGSVRPLNGDGSVR